MSPLARNRSGTISIRIAHAITRGDFIDAVHAMADHVDNDLMITSPTEGLIPPLRRSSEDIERIETARAERRNEPEAQ